MFRSRYYKANFCQLEILEVNYIHLDIEKKRIEEFKYGS